MRDRGPGIPKELASAVFERFVQVPGRPSRGGSGLGLAIAKHVVKLHRGSVSAHERPEGGCSLTVRLPAAPAA